MLGEGGWLHFELTLSPPNLRKHIHYYRFLQAILHRMLSLWLMLMDIAWMPVSNNYDGAAQSFGGITTRRRSTLG